MTIEGNKQNFEAIVLKSEVPVLVDFWASWCGPCQRTKPILESLAKDLGTSARIVTVNVDEEPELADQYDVLSIPTLALFKDGKVIDYKVGVHSASDLKDFIFS